MRFGAIGREASAGVIVGLSSVIYSLSYGALLFSGSLAPQVGYGITIALITAVVGALSGWFSDEKSFIAGPDSNTFSVQASMLAGLSAGASAGPLHLDFTVGTVLLTSIMAALSFYLVARARLSSLVRYIPFSVMAGFLASTGWLMSSGALNIISGTPLTYAGFTAFFANPARPELAFGVVITCVLFGLARRVPAAILIPLVMVFAALAANLLLASGLCPEAYCSRATWMFARIQDVQWLPPWKMSGDLTALADLAQNLPSMLVVCFVGLLTILISVASLELNFHREFDLNRVLKVNAAAAGVSAALGGFIPLVSIGRTLLNKQTGGGALAATIAAAMCVAMLLGAGQALAYVPKAALGGLVLFLGVGMLKQWLWDQRRATRPIEFAQIALILVLVANYGFLVGFSAGLLISCIVFVVSYSRVPLAELATNLSLFASSVVRPESETQALRAHGAGTLLFRLGGYVFFGSASKIDAVFQALDDAVEGVVIDFSKVSGIDSSAVGVFQRILRRYRDKPTRFYLVYGSGNEASVRAIAGNGNLARLNLFASLDQAVETAEDAIIAARAAAAATPLAFFESTADRAVFLGYCEMKHVRAGETLCTEGDRSAEIFFIENGSLEVVKSADRAIRLAKLHKGAMVGELAFYTGDVRTASIVAVNDSSVYVLHNSALARLRHENPDLAGRFDHMVIQKLSNALTRTNKLVATFR